MNLIKSPAASKRGGTVDNTIGPGIGRCYLTGDRALGRIPTNTVALSERRW
jgi:hypothetical protein